VYDLDTIQPLLRISNPDETVGQHLFGNQFIPMERTSDLEDHKVFLKAPLLSITLTQLKALYERNDKAALVRLLPKRVRITIDNDATVNPTLAEYSVQSWCLDFLLIVPIEPGLSVLLPPTDSVPRRTWLFELNLKNNRAFRMKHGALGFDTANAVLHIGQLDNQDIWLGMAPDDFVTGTEPGIPAESKQASNTFMTPIHHAMVLSYFLHCLTLAGIQGISCPHRSRYYMASQTDYSDWSFATHFQCVHLYCPTFFHYSCYWHSNAIDRDLCLNVHEARSLHAQMSREHWEEWRDGVPPEWMQDQW
jgi:hypothetical protein